MYEGKIERMSLQKHTHTHKYIDSRKFIPVDEKSTRVIVIPFLYCFSLPHSIPTMLSCVTLYRPLNHSTALTNNEFVYLYFISYHSRNTKIFVVH